MTKMIRTTIMNEPHIDLRKDKNDESITAAVLTQNNGSISEQKIVVDELVINAKPLGENNAQIQVKIDFELISGNTEYMEDLKLEIMSEINQIIIDAEKHTKDSKGYTVGKVKIKTQIISR